MASNNGGRNTARSSNTNSNGNSNGNRNSNTNRNTNRNKNYLATSPLPPPFEARPHGGYPEGFRYPAEEDGRRLFRLQVTPELRDFLQLPEEELYWGSFYNRKPIEAASKAPTAVCRTAAELGERQCPELMLPVVAPLAQTRSGPKVNRYWISRRQNPAYREIHFRSGHSTEYQWFYDILPEKRRDKEDALQVRQRHSLVAKERYERLAVKPRRYSPRANRVVKSRTQQRR